MNIFKNILRQTSWQLIAKAVSSISTVLILGVVARTFGPTGTGVFTQSLLVITLLSLAVDLGINAHVLRHFVGNNNPSLWRELLGARLLMSAILVALTCIGLLFVNEQSFAQAVLIGLIYIPISAIVNNANLYFQSKSQYHKAVIANCFGSILGVIAVYSIAYFNFGIAAFVGGYSIGWVAVALVSLILIYPYVRNFTPKLNLKFIWSTIKEIWPISMTLMLNVVYFRVDSFFIEHYQSFRDVGVYNLSYQIFQSALVLPTFVMNSFYPQMLRSYVENTSLFVRQLKFVLLGMFGLSMLGLGLTLMVAPLVVNIISGSSGFDDSVQVLQILSFGFPAYFLSSVLMWSMMTFKKYKLMAAIYAVGLIFNIVSNRIFIPQYSYFAAAFITIFSEYLILLLQVCMIYKYLKAIKLK